MTTGVTPETEHLTYGPVAKRKCRDVIFLILFLAFWVGMAIIAWKGVQIGNPRRLKYGTDMYGAVCGFNNEGRTDLPEAWRFDLTNKPVLYYPTPFEPGMHFCIEHCPNDTVVTDVDQYICRYDITPSSMEVASGNCWPPYASSPIFNRCVPFGPVNGTVGFVDKQINAQEVSMQILSDVAQAWPWIAASAAVAFGIGLVWLIFIRFFTGLLVWLTILFVYVFFFGLTAFLLWQAKLKGDDLDKLPEEERLDHDKRQHTALQVAGYVLIAIDVIMLLLLIWMRRRIALAIGILKQATKAVAAMPSILVFPAFTFAAQVAFGVYWIAIMVFIATAGQAKFNVSEDSNNATAQNNITEFDFTGMSQDNIIRGMQVYHLFGYFWTAEFVAAFGQICLALSVATWYWTKEKKDLPRFIVAGAVAKVFRYHLGSIAFGSLIIAIVRFIRAIIAYVQKRLKRYDNRLVKFLLKCLDCCFACFERFLKFINKRAYIMIAIKGESFCGAARSAFGLLLTNILRVGVVGVISNFLLFLGRVLITIGATLFGAYILSKDEDLHFWMIPVVIIAIIAYFISHCFMAVYDMAVDTILLCFCEDEAQGQHSHQYYNKDLKEFIDGAHKGICCC